MNKQSYREKLRDPRWQKVRLEVMNRDDFSCQNCGDRDSTLNVHHLQYHGDPWESPLTELETLCEKCHDDRTVVNKQILSQDTRTFFKWVRYINAGIKADSQPRPRMVLTQKAKDEFAQLEQERVSRLLKAALAKQEHQESPF